MKAFTIFHVNDLHGRDIKLAQIATIIDAWRLLHPDMPTLFIDAGDAQSKDDGSLSDYTHGVAMHRLLGLMDCKASVLGNKCIPRWGLEIVREYADHVPILLANLATPDQQPITGTQPTMLLNVAGHRLGLIGVTDDEVKFVKKYQLHSKPLIEIIHAHAEALRQAGADAIILLSHMGFPRDLMLAQKLQGVVKLIIGGHSHTSLPEGLPVGDVMVVHAGAYGHYVGQIDLMWTNNKSLAVRYARLRPVMPQTPPSATIMDEIRAIRAEIGLPEHN